MTGADEIHQTEIDGVRTLWCPSAGPFKAVLAFRTGRADETLATSGISHLAEHLALYRLGRDNQPVRFNGQVDPVTTAFVFQGAEDAVVAAVESVCRDLHDPPVERWSVERGILQSEEDQRSTSGALPSMLRWRYGSESYGLSAYSELGLRRLTQDDLQLWCANAFTTANATLAVAGEIPTSLRLPLPTGFPMSTPPPTSAVDHTPSWYIEGSGTASFLTTIKRGSAATALRHVLERSVLSRLRYELGASYSPMVGYEPRDLDNAHLWVVAEAVEGRAADVTTGVLDLLADAARELASEADLESWRSAALDQKQIPGFTEYWMWNQAREILLGGAYKDYDSILEEVRQTRPEDVRERAVEAAWNALYRLPDGTTNLPGLTLAPIWSTQEVHGRSYTPAGNKPGASSLTVGPDGVMIVLGGQGRATIRWDGLTAMLAWPWGRRMLYGRDGFVIDVDPTKWLGGVAAVAEIDAKAAPESTVPMPDPVNAPKVAPLAAPPPMRTPFRFGRKSGT